MCRLSVTRSLACASVGVLAVVISVPPALGDGVECIGRSLLATFGSVGNPCDVDVGGDVAYLVNSAQLLVLDVSTPFEPHLLASVTTGGQPCAVRVRDNLAFVAASNVGLLVYDVATPQSPVLVGSLPHATGWYKIAIDGDLLLMTGTDGVLRVDISDPTHPVDLNAWGAFGEGWLGGVDAHNGTACTGGQEWSGGGRLYVCTFSTDPFSWTLNSSVQVDSMISDVQIVGDLAYVAAGDLVVVDIVNPNAAYVVASVPVGGEAFQLDAQGGQLAVSTREDGVSICDLSDPRHPVLTTRLPLVEEGWGIALHDSLAFACDSFHGLDVFDVSTPRTSPMLASIWPSGSTRAGPFAIGDLVALGGWRHTLQLIDVSDPTALAEVSIISLEDDALGVDRAGDVLFVAADTAQLPIFDIADPQQPNLLSTLITPGTPKDVRVHNNLAYIADDTGGLVIAEVSDPASPAIVSTTPTGDVARSIVVAGSLAVVGAGSAGVELYDVADPAHPALLGVYTPSTSVGKISLVGNTLHVPWGSGDVDIVDISSPSEPVFLSRIVTELGFTLASMAAREDRLYLLASDGLVVYNIADPMHPRRLARTWMSGLCRGFATIGELGLISDTGSLMTFDLSDCACLADIAPPLDRLDFFDLRLFLNLFAADSPRADYNADGQIDVIDVLEYLDQYSVGCD